MNHRFLLWPLAPARSWLRALVVAVLLMPALAAAPAPAASNRAVIVFDGSDGMRSDLAGASRLARTAESLQSLLKRYRGQLDLGLIGFGLSRTAGCDGLNILSPVAPISAGMLERLAQVKAKGSAPVAKALELAARELGTGDVPGTVIVVAGGGDNCSADPCAVARLLGGVSKLRIAVVAIEDDRTKPNRSLRCLAARTGGKFWLARNASELYRHLAEALAFAAEGAGGPEPAAVTPEDPSGELASASVEMEKSAATEWDTAALPEAPAAADPAVDGAEAGDVALGEGTASLALSALIAEQGPVIGDGLTWRIYQAQPGEEGQMRLVRTLEDAAPRLNLPAGEYFVNVAYGRAYLTERLVVDDGSQVEKKLVLNVGGLRVRAMLPDGEEIPSNAAACDIYSDERDQLGNRTLIVSKARLGKVIRLNSGLYHLVSTYGDANAVVRADISVEAGKLTEAIVQHKAARVTLKLVLQPGGEALADTRWSILAEGGRIVKESAGALPSHILSPGTYIVEAIREGQKYAGRFSVAEGDVKVVELATQ